MAFFRVPLNLPHAAKIVTRVAAAIQEKLGRDVPDGVRLTELIGGLQELLFPYWGADSNPPPEEAEKVRREAAKLGRELVDEIERLGLGGDRLGQCVRNLFECLELGEEGAAISLRAGESPDSPQRP